MSQASRLGLGVATSLYLLIGVARAEGPTPSAAGPEPASAAASNGKAPDSTASDADVIRLKNGGLVRGKISELIPGESVTIVTITGKTREFAMSEVDYAGPVDGDSQHASAAAPSGQAAPKAPGSEAGEDKIKPYVTVHAAEARLKLVSDESGITFHRQAASASSSAVAYGSGGTAFALGESTSYERICTAPCEAAMPAGSERFALSRDGKPPIAADAVTLPAGDSELHGRLESRTGLRVALVALGVASAIGGTALALTADGKERECNEFGECYDRSTLNLPQFIGGIALGTAGAGLMLAIVLIHDKAVIEVRPQNAAAERHSPLARGIALSGHF